MVVLLLVLAGCLTPVKTGVSRNLPPCEHGRCPEGYSCRYDRDQAGKPLERCAPEPGRCRFATDCPGQQRCVTQRSGLMGVCWDIPR